MSQTLFGPNGFIHFEEDAQQNVSIFWAGKNYYTFNRGDRLGNNVGIALMSSLGVYQRDICSIFQIGRRTITRVAAIFKAKGLDGLKDYQQGPKVIDEGLRSFVIGSYQQLEGSRGYQNKIMAAIQEKHEKGELASTISRQSLHLIIKEYRRERERVRKEREEQEKLKEERHKSTEDRRREEQAQRRAEEVLRKQQLELTEQMEGGERRCVEAGGAVVTAVYVNAFGMMKHIPGGFQQEDEERFSNQELAVAYAALNAAKLLTVEQGFKNIASWQMGGIIGRYKLPSLSLYRSRIPKVVGAMRMREVIRETAKELRGVMGFSPVVYIDGHFMPYYGGSCILSGYNSQRRLAMGGREYFFVHDEYSRPVYAMISDGYRKMKYYLEVIDKDLRYIYGAGEKELLEIFDRGGYSKEFCVGIADRIRFVCWRSDARVVPKGASWQPVEVQRQGNEYGRWEGEKLYCWERRGVFEAGGKREELREVWIRKGDKVSPALTNDWELSLEEVVRKLTGRWGAQENGFKKLKEHGIDRIHSYLKEEYTEEHLYERGLEDPERGIERVVDNPVVKRLGREIRQLKETIEEVEWAQQCAEERGRRKDVGALKRKRSWLEKRLLKLLERKAAEPKKVLLWERIQEEGVVRIWDEKKLFFDWLKMGAMWSRQRIVETVKPYYRDLRDVHTFVDSILRSRTYVRIADGMMGVEFPHQHSKRKQEALAHLCVELNTMANIDIGLKIKKLVFSVR